MAARRRGPARLLIAGAALAGVLMIVILGALAGAGSGSGSTSEPSAVAIADIPGNYLVAYQRAGMLFGVDWAILAAIGKMECDHGRSSEQGCAAGTVNSAGATGPMQFLAPTWRKGATPGSIPPAGPPTAAISDGYATDGDGDGIADIWNPYDAVAAAARYLRANGAPADYQRAIFAYNHSQVYVDGVLAKAGEYRGAFAPGATGTARTVLLWAVAHVGRYTYSQGATTDRGVSVAWMQTHEPSGTTCDCSMFVRWSMAQAGLNIGHTTVDEWYADGLLPNSEAAAVGPGVVRGVGAQPPPGGYLPGDMIFFGHGAGNNGHVALYLGDGQLVQCSSSGDGSNIRPLAGYLTPTGWVRWHLG